MIRKTNVGFSQRIQLAWLEQTAVMAMAGNSPEQIKSALEDKLQAELSVGSEAKRSNRSKAISILLNIWVSVSPGIEGLRHDGLALFGQTPAQKHLPLHWGMSMAAYPFFGAVAETAGRLLQLQGTVASAQIQQRLREQFGERETVSRAARRILRCFIDWGVLQDTAMRGVYGATPVKPIEEAAMAAWLIEAVLLASDSSSKPLQAIIQSPALFPFGIRFPNLMDLAGNNRLELSRQGLDVDMVSLRTV